MVFVRSSAVSAVGYDALSMRMRIRFVEGRSYDFCGVPPSIYQGLLNSFSKGSYYNQHIRDRYRC
ncbi:KTSC domain-containing protein [Robbsia sp. Bb-Pol-6]|uniref:KTSC domain-containing protein n=2 Tax=Robbsia betulipollinis TaxID=2981849 RepID=A0ABT3ZTH6_9BURK|nr:KTSC domain-containing protein [Robbsia betulipollinis]MCY0389863.1 KTSC domain-containing protein [Robbsia betulipollinis]